MDETKSNVQKNEKWKTEYNPSKIIIIMLLVILLMLVGYIIIKIFNVSNDYISIENQMIEEAKRYVAFNNLDSNKRFNRCFHVRRNIIVIII